MRKKLFTTKKNEFESFLFFFRTFIRTSADFSKKVTFFFFYLIFKYTGIYIYTSRSSGTSKLNFLIK